jgi:hypothetical protein
MISLWFINVSSLGRHLVRRGFRSVAAGASYSVRMTDRDGGVALPATRRGSGGGREDQQTLRAAGWHIEAKATRSRACSPMIS